MLPPLIASVYVALGGAIGAVMRYQLGRGLTRWLGPQVVTAFPWATLAVNIVGSIAMGLLAGWMVRSGASAGSGAGGGDANANAQNMTQSLMQMRETWRLLLGVGLLGGFTTFSSFSLELMVLIERGQSGQALSYALISVLAGLTGLYLGMIIMRISA